MSSGISTTKATAILVLGMHRSGTSAVTRVLNLLGAELGPNLLKPQADNEKGFWEHYDAYQVHERLLTALERTWHDALQMPADWLNHPASQTAKNEIVELIRRDFLDAQLWAIKDPRMCRLAPLWVSALEELGIKSTVLLVVRRPREVADSLFTRDGWTYAHSYLLWAQYFLDSVMVAQAQRKAVICYDDLLDDWRSSLNRVTAQLGIDWPRSMDETATAIESFLNPADRHHRDDEVYEGPLDPKRPPELLAQLFNKAKAATIEPSAWSAISSMDGDFKLYGDPFERVMAEQAIESKRLADLAEERIDRIGELEREGADKAQRAAQQHAELSRELDELTQRHAELSKANEEVTQRYAELGHEHQELVAALSRSTDLLTALQAELEIEKSKVVALEETVKRAQAFGRDAFRLLKRIWQLLIKKGPAPDIGF